MSGIEERSHFLISILSSVLSNSTRQYQRPPSRDVPPSSATSPPRMGWISWYPWSVVEVAALPGSSSPTPAFLLSLPLRLGGMTHPQRVSAGARRNAVYYMDANRPGSIIAEDGEIIAGKFELSRAAEAGVGGQGSGEPFHIFFARILHNFGAETVRVEPLIVFGVVRFEGLPSYISIPLFRLLYNEKWQSVE